MVYVLMHGMMFLNAAMHPAYVGYDGQAFMEYITALSGGHLPTYEMTPEYFSPPLPFVLPALLMRVLGLTVLEAAKIAQFTQVLASMGAIWFLIRLCRRVSLGSVATFTAVALLAMLPVYYRTFAMVRGEPWVFLFVMMMLDRMVVIWLENRANWKQAVLLGVILGLGLLSRHWMIFTVPMLLMTGLVVCWKQPARRIAAVRVMGLSLLVAFVISGWFFLHLKMNHGSFTAFNRPGAKQFALSNHPRSFYMDLALGDLMTHPRRPHLANKFWPTMYADTFGDYWCYFVMYIRERQKDEYIPVFRLRSNISIESLPDYNERIETNIISALPYMARVMRVSLYPAMLMAVGLVYVLIRLARDRGLPGEDQPARLLLLMYCLLVATTALGYGWFLIAYAPNNQGDTIKPTYILHVFPFLTMGVGLLVQWVFSRWMRVGMALLAMLVPVWVYCLPMMLSHHGILRGLMQRIEGG